jgi:hypothetical protein
MAIEPIDEYQAEQWSPVQEPLKMLKKRRWRSFMFLFPNLALGPLGVYLALLMPVFSDSYSLHGQFEESLKTGALYTFAIAFLASTLALLLQGQSPRSVEHVWRWKTTAIMLVFALVIASGVCAGLQQAAFGGSTNTVPSFAADSLQVVLCLLCVVAAVYSFLLAIYEEDLDDFAAEEAKKREELVDRAKTADSDGRGIEL